MRRVYDTVLQRTVALKLLHASALGDADAVQRFVAEARATARLQHPAIVPVHDLGTFDDGRIWFTMKQVRGLTQEEVIRDVHRSSSPTALRRALACFVAGCRGVAYAHSKGVVHRDLKPANVMVGRHGEVYILDWGLVKIVGAGPIDLTESMFLDEPSHHTRAGWVAGTPAYMSPEQARGAQEISSRADIYSLGAILHHILAGRPPFEGSVATILDQVLHHGPKPLEGVDPRLAKVAGRAMQRDPAGRHPTADDLADAVSDWLDGIGRREAALELVQQAERIQRAAGEHRDQGARELETLRGGTYPPEQAWALEDAAERALLASHIQEAEVDRLIQRALQVDDQLREARRLAMERAKARMLAAERSRDRRGAATAEADLLAHSRSLPADDPARIEAERFTEGQGRLTLSTSPAGGHVTLHRWIAEGPTLTTRYEGHLHTDALRPHPAHGVLPLRHRAPGVGDGALPGAHRPSRALGRGSSRRDHTPASRPPAERRSAPPRLSTSQQAGSSPAPTASWAWSPSRCGATAS